MIAVHITAGVAALALLAGPFASPSVNVPQDPAQRRAPPKFVIEAGEHNLPELIDRAGRFLKHNYVLSPADLDNLSEPNIVLQNPLALDPRQCEEVVGQLARARGLYRIPLHAEMHIYQWIAENGPYRAKLQGQPIKLTADQVIEKRNSALRVLTSVEMKHVNPMQATNVLRPFFANSSGSMTITTGAIGGSIMLAGLASQVAEAIELLHDVDRPVPEAKPALKQQLEALEQRVLQLENPGHRKSSKD